VSEWGDMSTRQLLS